MGGGRQDRLWRRRDDVAVVLNDDAVGDEVGAVHHGRVFHQLLCGGQKPGERKAASGQRLHQRRVAVRQEWLHEAVVKPGPVLGQERLFAGRCAVVYEAVGVARNRVGRGGLGR